MRSLERMYRIDRRLKRGYAVSIETLMEDLACSRATVYRDIIYLRDYFNAPLIKYDLTGGYLYDPEAELFELPGFWFSPKELYVLLVLIKEHKVGPESDLHSFLSQFRERIKTILKSHH